MTLFSLAKRNVLGNLKNYLIYFISMIFSVVIYYTFVTLRYSEEIAVNVQKWEGMREVFTQASLFLILFAAVFIWYSNSFFTKKRKKEIGLYALLGVRKRTIGKMLFYENMLMGVGAVSIGIIVGTVLSKLFAMVFLKLLDSAVEINFRLSTNAILQTIIVFAVIILLTSVHSYRLIYRFRLVQLFQAEQEGEHVPKPSSVTAVMAIILLVFGYWLVFQPMTTGAQMGRNLLLIFGSIIGGTYLLFRFGIIYLLKLGQRVKSRYYQGMNMISISQLIFRIQGNTRMFTMIALLSAFTLCAVTVGSSAYYTLSEVADQEAPFSYTHTSQGETLDNQVKELIASDQAHPVTAQLDISTLRIKADLTKFYYHPSGFTANSVPIKLLSIRTYNEIAKTLHREEQNPLSDQEILLIRPMYATFSENDIANDRISFMLHEVQLELPIKQIVEGRVLPWGFPDLCFIVSDSLFARLQQGAGFELLTYKAYQVKDQQTTERTSDALMKLKTNQNHMSSYYYQYRQGIESAGMNIFILGFLGLVFLAATGSMIYFKQLTDAHADKGRYEILRKIGVSRKEIHRAIAKQTLFVFLLPLILGVVHSLMILKALITIQMISSFLLTPIVIAILAYVFIYLGYYVLCVNSFNRIVNK
ncbi:ABC transporter permease [Paenibacillus sp. HWE-109]|uniref:ABC transporter permease n=1 Tax=Paenibacillus sp. HWE-109 TaxID=1306526 RepID=UPI001EDD08BB|nr:ABC transporter permease [Paenibacillus sp. HWE-109]UKS30848.1 ABC transporter permease [Paenibacillus sp. HWE-109]